MTNYLKQAFHFVKDTIAAWSADYPSRMAAALAYRGIFSLIPLLFIAIIMVGLVYGRQTAENEVGSFLESTIGPQATEMVLVGLNSTTLPTTSDRWLISLLTLGVLFYAASGLFSELEIAMNTIWQVPYSASTGVWSWLKNRFIAVVMVLGVGFFFLSLMVINTAMSILNAYIGLDNVIQLTGQAVSLGATALIIAMIYKFTPDIEVTWKDVWLGAIVTALLMVVGIWLLGLYLAYGNVGSAYGAAGALLVILIWFYYSAMIFLFGAKLTQTYATKFGSKIG